MIDTHCHLTDNRISSDLKDVMEKTRLAGVDIVLCATSDIEDSRQALNIARANPGVFCTAGIHPHNAANAEQDMSDVLSQLLDHEECVAIGEIGLDYHYDFSPRDEQRKVFEMQLDIAAKTGSRVVVHTREAFDDTLAILSGMSLDFSRVVFHSFTGDVDQGRKVLDLGCSISFSGIVTFKNADELRKTASMVPDDRLLAETDSPYLAPEPVRNTKINYPANVVHVVSALARIRNTSLDSMVSILDNNARQILGLQLD